MSEIYSIFLIGFRGIRIFDFVEVFKSKKEAAVLGQGTDLDREECLLYAGHVGISFLLDGPIYGFSPTCRDGELAKTLAALRQPAEEQRSVRDGVVSDDTAIFLAARNRGVEVLCLEYKYDAKHYESIRSVFEAELKLSLFRYSFYKGGGDCNCATWPDKLGLWPDMHDALIPDSTGQIADFMKAMKLLGAFAWLEEGR